MASSHSPQSVYSDGSGSGGPSTGAVRDKSPLGSMSLSFLKTLTEKRTTRDGNPPKRRGPKPDSKPALTRRQELNRQAQRTHRERKELYIKALEDEVLRLKEVYSNICQEKEKLAEENRQLKVLVAQNGLSFAPDEVMSDPGAKAFSSSGSLSVTSYPPAPSSHTSAFTPPPMMAAAPAHLDAAGAGQTQILPESGGPVDYDQAGIDFVLTLEKPCMDHMPLLLDRGAAGGSAPGEPCGHALMASCPPEPFSELTPDIPFGYTNVSPAPFADGQWQGSATPASMQRSGSAATPAAAAAAAAPAGRSRTLPSPPPESGDAKKSLSPQPQDQRTWELDKGDLATLLNLSRRLDLDGEITPVMAWGMVLAHPRRAELRPEDFGRLTDELTRKVRCYGFGAVLEEFEVRDALENVLSTRPDYAMAY